MPRIVYDKFLIPIVCMPSSMLHQYPNVGGAEIYFSPPPPISKAPLPQVPAPMIGYHITYHIQIIMLKESGNIHAFCKTIKTVI